MAGRIGCFINRLETEMTGYPVARFNWLEFEDDPAISAALLETASQWAQAKGAKAIKGPLGFANLDNGGMTVEGFEEMGTVGAPYHHPYYLEHLERAGFRKKTDYLNIIHDASGNVVGFCVIAPNFSKAQKKANPILEENQASLALFQDFGPRVFRRRRVFEKGL